MEDHNNIYTLEIAICERLAMPLSEVRRQIEAGYCRVNGKIIKAPKYGVISGCRVDVGQTMGFTL